MSQPDLTKTNKASSLSRRDFIATSTMALTAAAISASPLGLLANPANKIKAIAFDAFPIFDPRPVFKQVETMFPENGTEISNNWKNKQFEYSWLRTAGGQYKNFWKITEDALVYAVKAAGVDMTPAQKKQLMEQYLNLDVWKDVIPALDTLKQSGIRLSFLSNFTEHMLRSSMKYAKIEDYFHEVISTDKAKTFKPSPAAYQLGIDTLKLKKGEILFAAFAGWDASGAKWFGYPTFWVNRQGKVTEELNAAPDGIGKGMNDLVNYLK